MVLLLYAKKLISSDEGYARGSAYETPSHSAAVTRRQCLTLLLSLSFGG